MYGCKDEELTLQRVPYTGNEIRTDGYYYSYQVNNSTPPEEFILAFFLYRNGIILTAGAYNKTDLVNFEHKMMERYKTLVKEKTGWGIFVVQNNKIEYEQWSTADGPGGGLPVFKNSYDIVNDTTLINYSGRIYHFKQFSPKPDSTNNFIK